MSESERLKKFREVFGLSQNEMAVSVGLKQGTWSEYENGAAPISSNTLIKLTIEYGLNQEWLKTGKGAWINRKSIIASSSGDNQSLINMMEKLQSEVSEMKTTLSDALQRSIKVIDRFTEK